MRLPFEQRTGTVGSRHDLCGVASMPARERVLKSMPETRFTVSIASSTEKARP
jgi:hypothetical protein